MSTPDPSTIKFKLTQFDDHEMLLAAVALEGNVFDNRTDEALLELLCMRAEPSITLSEFLDFPSRDQLRLTIELRISMDAIFDKYGCLCGYCNADPARADETRVAQSAEALMVAYAGLRPSAN